uniref:Uncharacterized protein n=1 Tax=Romanomermis culicivorax TaxID=13658 RepID=A0A915J088_ROMCU
MRVFTINNPWNGPAGNLSLSVNAFCRAIVEMIPFSREDFMSMEPMASSFNNDLSLPICKISSTSLNRSRTNPNQFCHAYTPFLVGYPGSDGSNVAANSK